MYILNRFINHCSPEFVQKCPLVVFKDVSTQALSQLCLQGQLCLQRQMCLQVHFHMLFGTSGFSCLAENHLGDLLLCVCLLMSSTSVFTNSASSVRASWGSTAISESPVKSLRHWLRYLCKERLEGVGQWPGAGLGPRNIWPHSCGRAPASRIDMGT